MSNQTTTPNLEINNEFVYRFPKYFVFLATCCSFALTLWSLMGWLLSLKSSRAFPWFIPVCAVVFLLGGMGILIINLTGMLKLKISEAGIFIPRLFQKDKYIPFININNIELVSTFGITTLELYVGGKKHIINSNWFSDIDSFRKIMEITRSHVPAQYEMVTEK